MRCAMQFSSSISLLSRSTFTPPICSILSSEPASQLCNVWRASFLSANSLCVSRTFSALRSLRGWNYDKTSAYKRKSCPILSGEVMMSSVGDSLSSSVFRLEDYDCIGFDLDNTLCEYNITPSVEMEYSVLANFLVKEKGYHPDYLLKPLDEVSVDFLQKGLFVDFARGNILKVAENGVISRASHGTKLMSDKEIIYAYGENRKWEVTSELSRNMLVGWNGPLSERVRRALLDYFDMPASIAFARIIDALDDKLGKPADIYNVWPDVLAGLYSMYKRDHFTTGEGGYFKEVKSNPHKFIKTCRPEVVDWLKELKRSKLTFLITGSNCDFASLIAETGLGKNWRSLFDVVVCYARKPGFFTGCRPFIELNGFKETEPVVDGIELGKMYNQGNWQELYQLFARSLDKQNPRCLYFGDNLVQDIYTPSKYTKCDTLAIVEELCVESNKEQTNGSESHLSFPILTSDSWDSYFYDYKENMNTLWGSILHNHAKICVPTLSVLAQYSISHEFNTFYKSHGGGYFPSGPKTTSVSKEKVNAV